ncbi:hypothetical protein PVAP13_2KG587350 [Panicum virgatum]|uniref:Uncharacterized protein n=1 Tax=Panicum virgatum TaxID=38727 RepID=A0A8T0WWK5_PANVG|nr:hypothetical protein PVAP13_2KG587350 [Panicum virgatum]
MWIVIIRIDLINGRLASVVSSTASSLFLAVPSLPGGGGDPCGRSEPSLSATETHAGGGGGGLDARKPCCSSWLPLLPATTCGARSAGFLPRPDGDRFSGGSRAWRDGSRVVGADRGSSFTPREASAPRPVAASTSSPTRVSWRATPTPRRRRPPLVTAPGRETPPTPPATAASLVRVLLPQYEFGNPFVRILDTATKTRRRQRGNTEGMLNHREEVVDHVPRTELLVLDPNSRSAQQSQQRLHGVHTYGDETPGVDVLAPHARQGRRPRGRGRAAARRWCGSRGFWEPGVAARPGHARCGCCLRHRGEWGQRQSPAPPADRTAPMAPARAFKACLPCRCRAWHSAFPSPPPRVAFAASASSPGSRIALLLPPAHSHACPQNFFGSL